MPFVTDIYPPAGEIEAFAGLGLAYAGRKGKGFPGRRQYEAVEVLGRFSVPLCTVPWNEGEEGRTALVLDPQGLLVGTVRFDLPPGGPQAVLEEETVENDFLSFCQQAAREAADFKTETVEITGLVTDTEQVRPLLKDDGAGTVPAGLEQTVDGARVVEELRQRLAAYVTGANAWSELKRQLLAYRDRQAVKINQAAGEARASGAGSLEELERQVQAAIKAKKQETEAAREAAREEHRKQRELVQSELERFRRQFEEKGEAYWREKIKTEEQRLAGIDKKLAAALEQLDQAEKRYAESQQERIKQFKAEWEKRLAAFEQRLKRLNTALAGVEKAVEKRLEGFKAQQKKIHALAAALPPGQCGKEYPVVFYAARYAGGRWQVFPPQFFSDRGFKGKVTGLLGGINLPLRPAGGAAEAMAARLQALLPGHDLEEKLVEQNLLSDPAFIDAARAGLARLIDEGKVHKKHAALFG